MLLGIVEEINDRRRAQVSDCSSNGSEVIQLLITIPNLICPNRDLGFRSQEHSYHISYFAASSNISARSSIYKSFPHVPSFSSIAATTSTIPLSSVASSICHFHHFFCSF